MPATVAVGVAALTITMLVVAARVLRPRVPERRFDQSADAYWSETAARGPAVVLWATIEGAGVVAAVGYYLTGSAAPALGAAVALVTMVALRPGHLEAHSGGTP
jgi:hypothetical protein